MNTKKAEVFNDYKKYLFAAALAVLIAFCGYFYYAFGNIAATLLEAKIADRRFDVDLICEQIDRFVGKNDDWNEYNYAEIISFVVSFIDSTEKRGSYAELFDADFNSLSNRTPLVEGSPFDPREYAELVRAVEGSERGEMKVLFDKPGVEPHDIYVYWRWVPTDGTLENRLVIVTGTSKYSVNANIGAEVIYGAVILIVVASVFILATVILLCQLGNIYTNRKGVRPDRAW